MSMNPHLIVWANPSTGRTSFHRPLHTGGREVARISPDGDFTVDGYAATACEFLEAIEPVLNQLDPSEWTPWRATIALVERIAELEEGDDDGPCCWEDDGGSHYHCGTCGEVTGMMGHMDPDGKVRCEPKRTRWSPGNVGSER